MINIFVLVTILGHLPVILSAKSKGSEDILQVDHTDIKAMTAEIQKIGVNVNQIAKRVNSTGSVYQEDIEEIKGVLAEIWRLQRLSLLKER